MKKNGDSIAVYSRKSRYTGKGESIGNQVELCCEYVKANYGEEALDRIVVYEDEGFSGGNLNRPAFKKMLEAARERKLQRIIVYRLDRISRNIGDFAGLIEELDKLNIDFISIREQFDTSTPMGRAMMYIASVFSQLERETIAERIRDNMHELAKTGRWLGGTTPTGYTSEAVKTVTVDGKTKKTCKLKLLPDEAQTVRMIFSLYSEFDSLVKTEAELLKRGVKTKLGNSFTRFAIKGILQNPVYLIADEDAYDYFVRQGSDLFSDKSAFDGEHGILAYNRTDQEKGRATVYLPTSEWIVSVGQHPGLIPGRDWIGIQEALERNKSKSYRKPRSNVALLTGLLYCTCGSRMYPKLGRQNPDGSFKYWYVCKMKERSQRAVCNSRNVNGEVMDSAVSEEIKKLKENGAAFIDNLEKSKKYFTGNREEYEVKLEEMRKRKAELERKAAALADTLSDIGDSSAKPTILKRIEQLNGEAKEAQARINELEGVTGEHALSEIEFDLMRQMLGVFSTSFDNMTVDQKRAAIRTVVRKVVWDGENAHLILFGSDEDADLPKISYARPNSEDEPDEELESFPDLDGEDDPMQDELCLGEDSKRDTHVHPRGTQTARRHKP
ncbi:MAG: recombinase family protein [Clostridia bacterium]|nr:recombinase family protein [Clostridia bacterium]